MHVSGQLIVKPAVSCSVLTCPAVVLHAAYQMSAALSCSKQQREPHSWETPCNLPVCLCTNLPVVFPAGQGIENYDEVIPLRIAGLNIPADVMTKYPHLYGSTHLEIEPQYLDRVGQGLLASMRHATADGTGMQDYQQSTPDHVNMCKQARCVHPAVYGACAPNNYGMMVDACEPRHL